MDKLDAALSLWTEIHREYRTAQAALDAFPDKKGAPYEQLVAEAKRLRVASDNALDALNAHFKEMKAAQGNKKT